MHGIAPYQVDRPPGYHYKSDDARKKIEQTMMSKKGISYLFRRKHLHEGKIAWFRDSMLKPGSSSRTICQLTILSTWITRWRDLNKAGVVKGPVAPPSDESLSPEAFQTVEISDRGIGTFSSGPVPVVDVHQHGSSPQALNTSQTHRSMPEPSQQRIQPKAADLSECVIKIGRVDQDRHLIKIDTTMVAIASVFNLYNWEARLSKFTAAVNRQDHKLFWFDKGTAKEIRTPFELECAVKLLYQRMDTSVDTQIISCFTAERLYQVMWLPEQYRNLAAYEQEIIEYDADIVIKPERA